jgi:hypothetical protein
MAAYMANGARLGWLLFAEQQAVKIWPAGGAANAPGEPLRVEPALELGDVELLPGLRLELAYLARGPSGALQAATMTSQPW